MSAKYFDSLKPLGDTISISAVVSTIAGWLPSIAAAFSIIWSILRIYETELFQRFLNWIKTWLK